MFIKVLKLSKLATLPKKATVGSLCYDIYAAENKVLRTFVPNKISTGLAFELPSGLGMDIRPRSGLSSAGIIMLNAPGTLDSDYRGELFILLMNLTSETYRVSALDRIAQIRFIRNIDTEPIFEIVEALSETVRGTGGLGSTGK